MSVALASTTGDVIAVYAAPAESGWRIRVVDEYVEEGSWYRPERAEFPEFPTLGEIIDLMDSVEGAPDWAEDAEDCHGIVERFWREQARNGGDIEGWVQVSSRTYPDLARYWLRRQEHFTTSP